LFSADPYFSTYVFLVQESFLSIEEEFGTQADPINPRSNQINRLPPKSSC